MRATRRVEWAVVAALAMATIALGMIGFEMLPATSRWRAIDKFYLTLQLFVLESGGLAPPLPWQLDLARFLAPAVTAYAAAKTLMLLFRDELASLRLIGIRNHNVIAGAGAGEIRLAVELQRSGERVAITGGTSENLRAARDAGAVIVLGDVADSALLDAARVGYARRFVAAGGDDAANIQAGLAARARIQKAGGGDRAAVFIQVRDPRLRAALENEALSQPADPRIAFVNVYERGALILAGRHPFDATTNPHIVLVGFDDFAESLLLHLARRFWFATAGTAVLRTTVVDSSASTLVRTFCEANEGIDRILTITARDVDIRSELLRREAESWNATTVYISCGDDAIATTAALTISAAVKQRTTIAVRVAEAGGVASVLARSPAQAFSLLDEVWTPQTFFADLQYSLAVALHEQYLTGAPTGAAAVSWSDLDDQYRESNLRLAAALAAALRVRGYDLRMQTKWPPEARELNVDDVDALARLEHERWRSERERDGWRYGPAPRDDARKTSPLLVGWTAIDSATQEQNRTTIRELPRMLARAGVEIARRVSA